MFFKGIKKGKTIELLEELNFPDNQEVLVEVRETNNFWSALQAFRNQTDLEEIDDDSFENLRDQSSGRDVVL
ncbi:UNVERIFIED_CONTAM: hypothetical protein BEN50_18260 [Euhalothece sp. KZN 001]